VSADAASAAGELDAAAAVFGKVRPRLFGIAYRMLGTPLAVNAAQSGVPGRWC
jgi:hypothetical protein